MRDMNTMFVNVFTLYANVRVADCHKRIKNKRIRK